MHLYIYIDSCKVQQSSPLINKKICVRIILALDLQYLLLCHAWRCSPVLDIFTAQCKTTGFLALYELNQYLTSISKESALGPSLSALGTQPTAVSPAPPCKA
jgi:hypothetical protein